jgi:peptidoglycan/xylan/chitin deacetylase (PgdA/CDA1 family)
MPPAIRAAKLLFLHAARECGVFEIVRNTGWRSQRLLILGYHGISIEDEHEWDPCMYMPQEMLRARFQILRRGGYVVLPLGEAMDRLYAGTLPARAVALTFDDGTYDFRARACPVLAEFGYPATVYLTTYYATHRYPVFNVFFSYLLWKGRGKTLNLDGMLPGHRRAGVLTAAERAGVLKIILRHCEEEKATNEQRNQLGRRLARQMGIDYDRLIDLGILHIMSAEDIAELPGFGATVQLHTHRHRAPEDEHAFRREVRENRDHIARMGVPAEQLRHFCYPSGRYKPEFFDWLRAEDVRTATTCRPGLASTNTPPLLLPRLIDTCHITPVEFEAWLTGAGHFLRRF